MARTARLDLREFSLAEAPLFLALNADPEVLRHTGDAPFADVAEAAALIRGYDRYRRHGFGRWSLYRRAEGNFIGWCGLSRDDATGEVDLGFRLFRAAWGQGYATEAARACLDLAFGRFGLAEVVARARPGNAASLVVLRKLGFREAGMMEREGQPWCRFVLRRGEAIPPPPPPAPGWG
ncbi:GNAT family N-acetyltransferase [Aerophototrophica crusticola]|uniref:GNAT family N-acetyltransferase n=1 Tax=Aerophototrophica crusticola TaxID=1709002 RepID=A0A858R9T0_9PROT|nr:GNAT family N-acetyltransferase [Rhodospirillaceae bacterium B3]